MRRSRARRNATIFGWASIGSGLSMVVAPRTMGRLYGFPARRSLVRMLGMRDVVIGMGLLRGYERSRWIRARALSEWMDAGLISMAASRSEGLRYLEASLALALGVLEQRVMR